MGAKSKYSENFSASSVAEEMRSLRSGRKRATSWEWRRRRRHDAQGVRKTGRMKAEMQCAGCQHSRAQAGTGEGHTLTRPNRMSVWSVRSCASSIIITLQTS
jgi:hypothetical protein